MADRDDTGEPRESPDDEAVQRERRDFLRRWKLKWSRLLRMRVTDEHIAQLIGTTAGTVYRKRNGRVRIKRRMRRALLNIDTVIDANRMPDLDDDCDENLKRAILSYQIRHPLSRQ